MPDRVLILGASARAAAASARRAGLTPFAIDLFADRDTAELCEYALRVPPADYPRGLFEAARRLPPMPWLYTGGLENDPDLVGELAAERELWGNGPDVLRLVRDPFALAVMFAAKAIDYPEVKAGTEPPPVGPYWLRKPLRGSGGMGVRRTHPDDRPSADHYYQRAVLGNVFSAVCQGGLVALSHQLFGCRWLHADGFLYAGSVGPLVLGMPDCSDIVASASRLRTIAGARSLFGIDFVHDGTTAWPVEVNPRYTASVEVHELSTRVSLLCRTDPPPPANKVVGKAVYYAARSITIPDGGPWDESLRHCRDVWRRPDFADIPRPDEVIEAGQPVVTLLADGPTETAVLATLKARAAELDRLFGVPTPEAPP